MTTEAYDQGVKAGIEEFLLYLMNDDEVSVVGIRTEDPDAIAGWSYRDIRNTELLDWATSAERSLIGN